MHLSDRFDYLQAAVVSADQGLHPVQPLGLVDHPHVGFVDQYSFPTGPMGIDRRFESF